MSDGELESIGAEYMKAQASLYKKLAAAMAELNRLPKTGENAFHKYKYVTDADVSDAVREALAKQGIAFFATMLDAEQRAAGNSIRTVVKFQFTFADGDTGATHSCMWQGEALDGQDKGLSKAATSAEKYFLLKTFMLSSGDAKDDPDDGPGDEPKHERKSQPQRQQSRPSADKTTAVTGDLNDAFPREETTWTKTEAEQFVTYWRNQALTDANLLAALGVSKLGDWKKGRAAADKAVRDWQNQQLEPKSA